MSLAISALCFFCTSSLCVFLVFSVSPFHYIRVVATTTTTTTMTMTVANKATHVCFAALRISFHADGLGSTSTAYVRIMYASYKNNMRRTRAAYLNLFDAYFTCGWSARSNSLQDERRKRSCFGSQFSVSAFATVAAESFGAHHIALCARFIAILSLTSVYLSFFFLLHLLLLCSTSYL